MAARHAVERLAEATVAVAQEDRLVLYAGETQSQSLGSGGDAQRVAGQLLDQGVQLCLIEPANGRARRRLLLLEDLQCPRTVCPERREQAVGVALGQLQLLGDSLARSALRQERLEERPALRCAEAVPVERKRNRYWSRSVRRVAKGIFARQLSLTIQAANLRPVPVDAEAHPGPRLRTSNSKPSAFRIRVRTSRRTVGSPCSTRWTERTATLATIASVRWSIP